MNNRLDDLKELVKVDYTITKNYQNEDLEVAQPLIEMQSFKEEASPEFDNTRMILLEAEKLVNEINKNNQEIQGLAKELSRLANESEEKKVQQKAEKVINKSNLHIKKLGQVITSLKGKLHSENSFDETEGRMLNSSFNAFITNFQASVMTFQSVQVTYKERVEKKITRQLQIIDPDLDREDLESALSDPSILQEKLSQKVIGSAHFSTVNAVKDIKEKYDDIVTLGQNIAQITQILQFLTSTISENSSYVAQISAHTKQAKDLTSKGAENLVTAKANHEAASSNKTYMFCCCMMCLLVVLSPVILITLQNLKVI